MYDGSLVLDVHGHVSVPQAANNHLVTMLGSNTPLPSPIGKPPGPKTVPREEFEKAAAKHVAYIDERGIDVQLIGPRPYLQMGWMEPHLIPAWAAYVNDTIHQQVGFHPDRFVGACQLPVDSEAPDAAHCIAELERCVGEFGFAAAYLSPDVSGRRTQPGLHDRWWDPLYARCQDLDVPIVVHGTNTLDPRVRHVPKNYQLSFLTEQYLAGQLLGHSDVFDRFPGLRFLICHCGGALNRFIPTDPHLPQRDLSGNLFYDSCGYDEIFLEAAIKQRGVAQIAFGTEAPGSGTAVRPDTGRTSDDLVPVIDGFTFLTREDKQRIFHDTPLRVVPGLAGAGRFKEAVDQRA